MIKGPANHYSSLGEKIQDIQLCVLDCPVAPNTFSYIVTEDSLHYGDKAENILLKRRDSLVVPPQHDQVLYVL